jgi:hypothetical protein
MYEIDGFGENCCELDCGVFLFFLNTLFLVHLILYNIHSRPFLRPLNQDKLDKL